MRSFSFQPTGAETVIIVASAVLVILLLALVYTVNRRLRARLEAVKAEKSRSEAQARDQMRTLAQLRADQRTVASLVRFLPSVVRELNSENLDPARVPELIIQLATAIFEPEQVLLYFSKPAGPGGVDKCTLQLRASHGMEVVPRAASVITFGAGKIGWVAETGIEMTSEDWVNLSRTEGSSPEDNHPTFKLDLIAPIVHHSDKGERVLGVLCIGDPATRPREPKLMMQMVTNLGSLALMNSAHLTQLREKASSDGLTGLSNKRALMVELGELITMAERKALPASVFIFDIDYFKRYNDSHGHLAGDDLLKTLARLVRDTLRPGDRAYRYGGEEFIVTMPGTEGDEAYEQAERIRQAVEQFSFAHGEVQPHGKLTISGGVASFPIDGTNGTELIGHADQALYQAKAAGRNRVIRFRGVTIGDVEEKRSGETPRPGAGLLGRASGEA